MPKYLRRRQNIVLDETVALCHDLLAFPLKLPPSIKDLKSGEERAGRNRTPLTDASVYRQTVCGRQTFNLESNENDAAVLSLKKTCNLIFMCDLSS